MADTWISVLGKVALILALALSAAVAAAEDNKCTVIRFNPEKDKYKVQIDGKEYAAINLEEARKLQEAYDKMGIREDEIRTLETTLEAYRSNFANRTSYVEALEDIQEDYRQLIAKYKKLKTGSTLTFEAGIGATEDTDPAIMLGLGLWNVRIWGFLQEGNAGALAGMSFPIW